MRFMAARDMTKSAPYHAARSLQLCRIGSIRLACAPLIPQAEMKRYRLVQVRRLFEGMDPILLSRERGPPVFRRRDRRTRASLPEHAASAPVHVRTSRRGDHGDVDIP